jgi:vacuolar-type H+-ATPase subunit H
MRNYDVFFEVFEVIKNPKKYQDKITELENHYNAYKGAVEAVTKLSDVNEYVNSIALKEAKAKETLELAQKEATAVVGQARGQADQLLTEAGEVATKAKTIQADAIARERKVAEAEKLLEGKQKEFLNWETNLKNKEVALQTLQEELELRRQKLISALQ